MILAFQNYPVKSKYIKKEKNMNFDQQLFDYVLESAKSFELSLDSRPVTPSREAQKALEYFEEPLSKQGSDAINVIKTLNEVGEPGVVSSRGGRYYGFVTGGALPVTVAANWLAAINKFLSKRPVTNSSLTSRNSRPSAARSRATTS